MTYDEIIKVLEYVTGEDSNCLECEYASVLPFPDCRKNVAKNALDLINRQKAEIERLEKDLTKCKLEKEMLYHVAEEIQTVTIEDFAERLKKEMCCEDDCGYHCSDYCYECKNYVPVIDKLVKERMEVEK